MDTQELIVGIVGAFFAAIGFAQAIVRLTPTTKDDRIVSKIGAFAEGFRNLLTLQKPSSASKDQNI